MTRRCENCTHWGANDTVWGDCTRVGVLNARFAVDENEIGPLGGLQTRFNFGCVEWKTARPANTVTPKQKAVTCE